MQGKIVPNIFTSCKDLLLALISILLNYLRLYCQFFTRLLASTILSISVLENFEKNNLAEFCSYFKTVSEFGNNSISTSR